MTASVLVRTTSTPDALVTRMADALSVPDGGFSVDVKTGRDVASGYAVAVSEEYERRFTGRVRPSDVRRYVYDHAAPLRDMRRDGVVVGGWRDPRTGVAYLDLSCVVSTRAEAEALARANKQLAYYDFASGQSVDV